MTETIAVADTQQSTQTGFRKLNDPPAAVDPNSIKKKTKK